MSIHACKQNDVTGATEELMARLLQRPTRSRQISARDTDSPFAAYQAGQEDGYEWGHEAGFGKGVAAGALAVAGLVTTAYLWLHVKSSA